MTIGPMEDNWRQIEAVTPFCCDAHRAEFKAVYFTGAMAALVAVAGWDPDVPAILCISAADLAAVSQELAEFYQSVQAEGAADGGQVRH